MAFIIYFLLRFFILQDFVGKKMKIIKTQHNFNPILRAGKNYFGK